jgi:hypothetical protein
MDDEYDPLTIKAMPHLLNALVRHADADARRHRERQRHHFQRIKDYFPTLARATAMANENLVRLHRPMRFCVYQKDEKVFIDIIELNAEGKVVLTVTKEITDEDFALWINDVSQAEGLVIDKEG